MSSCLIKKVAPLVLTFTCGVALWQAFGERRAPTVAPDIKYGPRVVYLGGGPRAVGATREREESRTWLFIRATSARGGEGDGPGCDGCSVSMRVLFGEDGAVPGNAFSLTPSSYPLIEEAVAAARRIEFTPATRNGRPVPVWANVTYSCGEASVPHATGPGPNVCSLRVDKDTARSWDGRPWRVVYE